MESTQTLLARLAKNARQKQTQSEAALQQLKAYRQELRGICDRHEGSIKWMMAYLRTEIGDSLYNVEAVRAIAQQYEAVAARMGERFEAAGDLRRRFTAETQKMAEEKQRNDNHLQLLLQKVVAQRTRIRQLWRAVFELQLIAGDLHQSIQACSLLPADEGDVFLRLRSQTQILMGYLQSSLSGLCD